MCELSKTHNSSEFDGCLGAFPGYVAAEETYTIKEKKSCAWASCSKLITVPLDKFRFRHCRSKVNMRFWQCRSKVKMTVAIFRITFVVTRAPSFIDRL